MRVVSATEAISQDSEGIILESLLEGMAEYYSAELAEKVLRGMKEIVTTFNDKGLRNRRGNPFKISVVSKILTNRRYIGEYKFRDIVIENDIPAIIPKEMFESVNNKLNANRKNPAKTWWDFFL